MLTRPPYPPERRQRRQPGNCQTTNDQNGTYRRHRRIRFISQRSKHDLGNRLIISGCDEQPNHDLIQ